MQSKLTHYDGLRGIVALWVFLVHLPVTRDSTVAPLGSDLPVPIFFILSGRVIANSALQSLDVRKIISAIIRRPFRLVLPIIIIGILDVIVFRTIQPVLSFYEVVIEPIWYLFDSGKIPTVYSDKIPVVWTLPVEFYGSYIVYYISLLLMHFKEVTHAHALVLIVCFIWSFLTHSWNTHFIAGLAIADLAIHGYMDKLRQSKIGLFFVYIFALLSCFMFIKAPSFNVYEWVIGGISKIQYQNGVRGVSHLYNEEDPVRFCIALSIVLIVETLIPLQRFLSYPVFNFIGFVSFPLYLFHPFWIKLFAIPILTSIEANSADSMLWFLRVLYVITCIVTLLLVSFILAYVLDKPSIFMGHLVEGILTNPSLTVKTNVQDTKDFFKRRANVDIPLPLFQKQRKSKDLTDFEQEVE